MLSTDVNEVMREVRDAKEAIKGHLRKRAELIRQMGGNHYNGGDDKAPPSPENYPYSYKSFVHPQLIFGRPTVRVNPTTPEYSGTAEALEVACETWGKETSVIEEFDAVVNDCHVGFGFTKAGISPVGRNVLGAGLEAVEGNFEQAANYPFLVRIDPACAIMDARAKKFAECRILGETYEQDLEDVKADPRNDPAAVDKLAETSRDEVTRPETQAFRNPTWRATRKRCVIHEVYLPEHGLIMVIGETGDEAGVVLRQSEYWGPDEGPYTLWGLDFLPGELLPCPPLVAFWDEYLEVAEHSRATARSAAAHKKFGVYGLSQANDAQRFMNAKPGEWVGAQDPNAVRDIEIGGASAGQISFLEFVRQRYERNLGYGPAQQGTSSSNTATGEQIADQNSDHRISRMRDLVARSSGRAYRKVAWYFFHDETIGPMQTSVEDPVTGQQSPATFRPGPWDGGFVQNEWVPPEVPSDFSDYHFEIDATSMTPTNDALEQGRAQAEVQLITGLVPVLGPQAINWRRVVDRYGDAMGTKGLSKIILTDQAGMMIPLDPLSQLTPEGMALGPQPGARPQGGGGPRPGGVPPAGPAPTGMGAPTSMPAALGAAQRSPF